MIPAVELTPEKEAFIRDWVAERGGQFPGLWTESDWIRALLHALDIAREQRDEFQRQAKSAGDRVDKVNAELRNEQGLRRILRRPLGPWPVTR